MPSKAKKDKLKITVQYSDTPMTQAEFERSETLLAKIVARMIASEQGWLDEEKDQNKGENQDV